MSRASSSARRRCSTHPVTAIATSASPARLSNSLAASFMEGVLYRMSGLAPNPAFRASAKDVPRCILRMCAGPTLDARRPAQEGHDVRCILVSHFHWDREWYRTFESYRARLVDAVDRVLDLLAADSDFRFLLDGQSILLEDYLAVRPSRRDELTRGIRERRLAVGPWYVQPDSLLPSGEAHVRNLLHGRTVAMSFGAVSRVGYVPDSFGHPAQLPQLLAGFGIASFVHWRGNGDEVDRIGTRYRWIAPDGSAVTATLLRDGYFDAACLPADVEEATSRLADVVARRGNADDAPVLLLNGFDHMLPDGHVAAVAEALARRTGQRVERGLLEDALAAHRRSEEHTSELQSLRHLVCRLL